MSRRAQRGFTLVEIMIVVAVIGVLIAIAIPGYLKARDKSRKNACLETQHKIDSAVQQYILDEDHADQKTAIVAIEASGGLAALVGDENYIRFTPECPAGGEYYFIQDSGDTRSGIPSGDLAVGCDYEPNDLRNLHWKNVDELVAASGSPL